MSRSPAEAPTPLRLEAEIVANRDEGGGNRRLRLRAPGWPETGPGQFAMLSAGALAGTERSDPLLPRPMAVYRRLQRASEVEIEILYRVCGRGTRLLAEALAGQRIRVVGPLGRRFPEPPRGGRSILVGGGTGVASLYQLAVLARDRGELRVLLGANTAARLMGRGDFEKLEVRLEITTEDGSAGRRGLVTEPLEEALAEDPEAIVYACGPTAMMRCCAEIAARRGARCYVSLENGMACGFGVCLGCASPRVGGGYALVCRDGPVFDAVEVDWEALP